MASDNTEETYLSGSSIEDESLNITDSLKTYFQGMSSELPQFPSMDDLPKFPSMDDLPKFPSMDDLPQFPSMDNLPQFPSMDDLPQFPSMDDLPQFQWRYCNKGPGTFAQLAELRGLPHEVHEVVTEDNYVLRVFRIQSKNQTK